MSSRDAPQSPFAPKDGEGAAFDAGAGTLSSAPSLSSLGLGPTPPAPRPAVQSSQPLICPACSGRYPADFRVCPRDATPLADAPEDEDPLVGATLGDSYEIIRVLGEGGMGRVYQARHTRLPNKRFAVKMLHHELARQPEVVARFQREAEAMAAIEHSNVVGVYDVNRAADGRPYIVQELLDGEELGRYLDRVGRLSTSASVRIVRQVCRALSAAHSRGIVHRDVKPENVILLGDLALPSVKMVDFGISKLEEGSALTKTGVVMGTPAYMAPEQARGDRVDARADVYSAGAILYRALTGHKPYEGLDQIATLTAVLSEEPPRPRTLQPSIPQALELVLQRAMAKEPVDRLARIEDLDAGLAPFDDSDSGVTIGSPGREARGDDKTMLAADARTLLGEHSVVDAARDAKLARPFIVLSSALGFALALLIAGDGVLGAVRFVGDPTRGSTTGELVLAVGLSCVLLLAPLVLWVRFVAKQVWQSTPRAIETRLRMKSALAAATISYALLALLARVVELAVQRTPEGIAHPGWSLLTMLLCPLAAVGAWFLSRRSLGRKRERVA